MRDYNRKSKALQVFLLYLLKKYAPQSNITLITSKLVNVSFYMKDRNKHIICISEKDFDTFSKYELCYILAHEFNHFLEDKNRLKNLIKELMVDLLSWGIVSICFLSLSLIIDSFNLSYWLYLLLYPIFIVFFSSPYGKMIKFKEETMSDDFANLEIGGGENVFINAKREELLEKPHAIKRIKNILKLGINFSTYPKTQDRINKAEQFKLRRDIKYLIDESHPLDIEDIYSILFFND
jgi:Zn-dependent protease with chaperone function